MLSRQEVGETLTDSATEGSGTTAQRQTLAADLLRSGAERTDTALRRYLDAAEDVPAKLVEAMSYSLFAGGKRLRPTLVLLTGELLGAAEDLLLPPAAAIECVHTFSLIHDDLPAMDDDDLRRGVPTSHVVFGEAMAILAGDGLLALAFEIIARHVGEPQIATAMVAELATATGMAGMVGGQVADILGEQTKPSEQSVRYIHERKTAALIRAACRLGAIAARAGRADATAVSTYGYHLGVAFQLADDVLDATATAEQLGKRTGKDTPADKQTLARLVGVEAAKDAAQHQAAQAIAALDRLGPAAEPLRALAEFTVGRAT